MAGYEDGRIYEEIFISFPTDKYILKYPYELCIYKLWIFCKQKWLKLNICKMVILLSLNMFSGHSYIIKVYMG